MLSFRPNLILKINASPPSLSPSVTPVAKLRFVLDFVPFTSLRIAAAASLVVCLKWRRCIDLRGASMGKAVDWAEPVARPTGGSRPKESFQCWSLKEKHLWESSDVKRKTGDSGWRSMDVMDVMDLMGVMLWVWVVKPMMALWSASRCISVSSLLHSVKLVRTARSNDADEAAGLVWTLESTFDASASQRQQRLRH